MQTILEVQQAIDQLRGKARVRIVNGDDLLQVLAEARRDTWGLRAGGTVANAYGYPASQMRLAAVQRSDGDYAVWCDWGSANHGGSPLPRALPRQYRLSNEAFGLKLREHADTNEPQWLLGYGEVYTAILLRAREARAQALASIRWSSEWDGPVTRADSLKAGNCERETERVAKRIRGQAISASKLRAWITRHEPTLANYADRAIEYAREGGRT